jgi:hypothetical protein
MDADSMRGRHVQQGCGLMDECVDILHVFMFLGEPALSLTFGSSDGAHLVLQDAASCLLMA